MKKLNIRIMGAVLICTALTSCQKKFDASSYAPPLSINGFTNSNDVAKGSLAAYWNFNGTLTDSISKTVGTGTGSSFTGGVKGSSLQITGSSYVITNTPPALQNLTSFTMTTWVYLPQNTTGIATLVDIVNPTSFWGNLDVFFENGSTATNGLLKVHMNNNGTDLFYGTYNVANPWNTWINIAVSFDAASSTLKVYANGSKIGTATGAGPIKFQNATKMVFGTVQFETTPSLTSATTAQSWASFVNGQMDEVRFYSKALSDDEVGTIVKLENRGK
jgi:hypothetical protein